MDKFKQVHNAAKDDDRADDTQAKEARKAPAPDKPDGPKEHVAAIRFLIGELRKTADDNAKVSLDEISRRIDLLEGKPEAVEDDKRKQLLAKEAEAVEKIRADRAKKAEVEAAKAA